jgi:hypothetical protein
MALGSLFDDPGMMSSVSQWNEALSANEDNGRAGYGMGFHSRIEVQCKKMNPG